MGRFETARGRRLDFKRENEFARVMSLSLLCVRTRLYIRYIGSARWYLITSFEKYWFSDLSFVINAYILSVCHNILVHPNFFHGREDRKHYINIFQINYSNS